MNYYAYAMSKGRIEVCKLIMNEMIRYAMNSQSSATLPSDARGGIINPDYKINNKNIKLFDFLCENKYVKGITFMVTELEFEPPSSIKSFIDEVLNK